MRSHHFFCPPIIQLSREKTSNAELIHALLRNLAETFHARPNISTIPSIIGRKQEKSLTHMQEQRYT